MGRRKKTNDEFITEVYELVGHEYEFLQEYINMKTKILCRHNKKECGHEWMINPGNFLKGNRCPICASRKKGMKRRKTNEQFLKEVRESVGTEYTFLEEYINSVTKIKCKHNICGYEWYVNPSDFLLGSGCPICANLRRARFPRKTYEQFIAETHELVGEEYEFFGEYINTHTKIRCKHNICGYKWDITPNSFLRGTRCPKCQNVARRTNEEFLQEVYELVGNEYEVLGKFIKAKTKVKMRHNVCEHEWEVEPANFLNGSRCPQCNESKGERIIREYLENQNINYKREYSFDSLIGLGEQPLRFDFAVFDNENNLELLVEYDGEFHYIKFYEDDSFETLQIHDERKNQYCKQNNIPLLRIPYWEFDNIEEILFKKLVKQEVNVI